MPRNSKVLLVTNPALMLLFVSVIAKLKSLRVHLLVHDVYPNNLLSAGVLHSKSSMFYKILNYVFKFAYQSATHLIVLGRDMREVISMKTNRPISIVENWAQLDLVHPINEAKLDHILPESFHSNLVFMFAGNFGRVQAIPLIIDFIDKLTLDNVSFVFAGKGYYTDALKQLESRNSNVLVLGPYRRKDQALILNSCDVALISLSKGMFGLGVPSKTYNILAAGKPILYIGEEDSEVDFLVKQNDLGWTLNDYSFLAFQGVIEKIIKEKGKLSRYSRRTRLFAEEYYSEEAILQKFRNVLLYEK